MDVDINYFAVLLAGLASMVVGVIWFGPMMFAKPLMRLRGYTPEEAKRIEQKMAPMYAVGFLFILLMAYVLALATGVAQHFYSEGPVTIGLLAGFWLWLGFVMPVQATHILFGNFGSDVEGKKLHLFAINTGNQLASLLVMGGVIGLMR